MSNAKFLFSLILIVFSFESRGLSQTAPIWGVSFPDELVKKMPVTFPIRSQLTFGGNLSSDFADFVDFIKTECSARFSIRYKSDQVSIDKALDHLESKAQVSERITCTLPYLVGLLNLSGKALQPQALINNERFDVPSTLAAAALNMDFDAIGKIPHEGAKLLTLLRAVSTSWSAISQISAQWFNASQRFHPLRVRQFQPWLTEFSPLTSLIKYNLELPCTDTTGAETCIATRLQISRIVQISLTRINSTPEVKRFLGLQNADKLAMLPQLVRINGLTAILNSTLDDYGPFQGIWSNNKAFQDESRQWSFLKTILKHSLRLLDVPMLEAIADTAKPGQEFLNIVLSTAKQDLTAHGNLLSQKNDSEIADIVNARALAYGLRSTYGGVGAKPDRDFLRRFLSLKQFVDLQQKANQYGYSICSRCSDRLTRKESRDLETMVGTIAQMMANIKELILVGAEPMPPSPATNPTEQEVVNRNAQTLEHIFELVRANIELAKEN
ncbi:MAG: hypothetical protein IT289_07715 [Oligoflexia bacterium]|nr:hypothetical protein [Oligoflexia bacterium]